jgi:ADP-heptose:LPS heptosyltransferase
LKILVINIKYLGDLIISSPGLRSLKKTYPDSEITLLIRKGFEKLFLGNPQIKNVITFDPELKGNSSIKKIIEGIRFIKKIRNEKFDAIIALHPGDRVAIWSWFSSAKIRIAPKKQNLGFLFNKTVDVKEDSLSYIEYYNKIFEAFGIKINSNKTEIFIPDEDRKWATKFLSTQKFNDDQILIGIHPGGSEPSKIWRHENFINLIQKLLLNPKINIILFEGPQDKAVCQQIKSVLINSRRIFFVQENILSVAALLEKCNLFIAHDTGTKHLAVSVNTPVLALIPDDNRKCWDFYSAVENHFTIIGRRNLNQDVFGIPFLDGIDVDVVYQKVGTILNLW